MCFLKACLVTGSWVYSNYCLKFVLNKPVLRTRQQSALDWSVKNNKILKCRRCTTDMLNARVVYACVYFIDFFGVLTKHQPNL